MTIEPSRSIQCFLSMYPYDEVMTLGQVSTSIKEFNFIILIEDYFTKNKDESIFEQPI